MSRRPARFTQSDVARAIRAAQQAGEPMAVEIAPDGTIRVVPWKPADSRQDEAPPPDDEKPLVIW